MDRGTQPIEVISPAYRESVYHLTARIPVYRAEFWKLTVSVADKPVNRVGAKCGIKFLQDSGIELPIIIVLQF